MFKGIDCRIRLGKVSIEDAQVVPGACAVWPPLRRVQKDFACFVKTLNVEQSNAFVQSSFKQRRIAAPRLPEKFKGLRRASPTHLGDTEIVGSNGVDVAGAPGRRARSPVRASDEAAEDKEKQQNRTCRTGPSPLLARRGGCASKKKVRSIRSGADGVVVQVQKHFRLILNHHPVRSIKGSFAIFLLMSRPPLLARRGYVAVRQVCPDDLHRLIGFPPNQRTMVRDVGW